METVIIFDSNFGNTKIIAETIAKELNAKAVSVSDFDTKNLDGIDLLVIGSPINAWRPSGKIIKFLTGLNSGQLNGLKAAAFDTRVKIFFHGDAAKKIEKYLKEAGAKIIIEPQVFFVNGKEGPLIDGQIEKAIEWARTIKLKAEKEDTKSRNTQERD